MTRLEQRRMERARAKIISMIFVIMALLIAFMLGYYFGGTAEAAEEPEPVQYIPDEPTGSVVYFDGIDGLTGGYIAEDTGAAIKGNKIDLYFDSHQDALEWGVQAKEVFVIE